MRILYYVSMFHMLEEAKEIKERFESFLKNERVTESIINEIFNEINSFSYAYWQTVLEKFDKKIKDYPSLFIYLMGKKEERNY